jgi:hypothetical protein
MTRMLGQKARMEGALRPAKQPQYGTALPE